MNTQKIQAMDMNLDKVINYSVYVDCFARILREFLENGYYNIESVIGENKVIGKCCCEFCYD